MKKQSIKKYTVLIGILFLFPLSWLLFFGVFSKHSFNTLPYLNYQVVGQDSIPEVLPTFQLIDQEGLAFHSDSLKGNVWLAAFYGTNNPYVAKITKRLLWPNFRYREEEDIRLVSFSMDTEHDQPEVLKKYVDDATKYHRFEHQWHFLTGNQQAIIELLQQGFKQHDTENTSAVFLVDDKGHVRGRYDGNREDEIKNAIEDIALLKKELDIIEHERRKSLEK
ncbi:MAG: SCO family protein [Flavobacteriales bacterium]